MFVQQTDTGEVTLVTSASDLTAASKCEFAFLRRVDVKLGRDVVVPADDDPMLARAGALGDEHEERVLAELRVQLGEGVVGQPGGVVSIPRPASMDRAGLEVVASQTLEALEGKADVVFQATFFDPAQRAASLAVGSADSGGSGTPAIGFIGFADFLELQADGSYEVQDTKLARKARVTALMQLAAYAEQVERMGVPVSPEATLILGDGARSIHKISDIAPVFRSRRERLHELLLARFEMVGVDGLRESAPAIAWGATGISRCGRCEVCEPEIVRTRDPLLIAGIRAAQRDKLVAAGFDTIDKIAAAEGITAAGTANPVEGMTQGVFEGLVMQAAVQLGAKPGTPPPVRIVSPEALAAIPQPNPGDLFFDFEGDPFYRETGGDGDGDGDGSGDGAAKWNLDYLFGMVDTEERFTPLWAHNLAEERQALIDFIAIVTERRREHPNMRVYHYAAYERTHLLSIASRHGACEAEVDDLLRHHVLVDLYPTVKRALRVGSRSYSIKKLEPLYMGDELRDESGVTSGGQSVVEYAEAREQLRSDDESVRAEGQRRLDAIADYNRYDCVSTLRLRDWLLSLAHEHGIAPFQMNELLDQDKSVPLELSTLGAELLELADKAEQPAARQALRLASSAIDYHQREQKSFWWSHFARLTDPVEDWADTRDVMVIDAVDSYTSEDWHMPPKARTDRRHLRLRGTIAPGSSLKVGSKMFAVYEYPTPFLQPGAFPGSRGTRGVEVIERHLDGVTVEEFLAKDTDQYDTLPIALTPGAPPPAGRQKSAIEEWGRQLVTATSSGQPFRDPVYELLCRSTPRVNGREALVSPTSEEALATGGSEDNRTIGAVVATLRHLDRSALAVQGPPGTGKTYLAARVIKQLVEQNGWRIGVVAQSHKVVENVLEGVVSAGLDPAVVGKVPQGGKLNPDVDPPSYTSLPNNGHARFLDGHRQMSRGSVIGGTAWDFSNEDRIERKSLDLLVIDEAGQFSLAPTIAASVSAERLLLLGDPQQLPQVSQGSHPEPVDTSALGWLLDDHETMPASLGYFLEDTRRMHPALTEVVSELSYEGRLHSHPSTATRDVPAHLEPGLHWVPVDHRGNATHSVEEADEIVQLLARLGVGGSELSNDDAIVVAAYNAQVECISEALEAAGYGAVRVGTVDKFQGQEALIAIVSLAASSSDDAPRGLEFLLMRNRLNVAISRAQWSSYVVSSVHLGDGLPGTAEGVTVLSGYLRLIERGA